jgi:hypothetical protein
MKDDRIEQWKKYMDPVDWIANQIDAQQSTWVRLTNSDLTYSEAREYMNLIKEFENVD